MVPVFNESSFDQLIPLTSNAISITSFFKLIVSDLQMTGNSINLEFLVNLIFNLLNSQFSLIAGWNANGLARYKFEVEQFLHINCIDLLLVSEKLFTSKLFLSIKWFGVIMANHLTNRLRVVQ